jgi:NADH-quinone oxidoreductase subunit J
VIYVVNLAHLVAAVQVIVYAGAVMTLFLFVIMLIGVDKARTAPSRCPSSVSWRSGWVSSPSGSAGALAFGSGFQWVPAAPPGADAPNGTIEAVAGPMFTDWVLAFEATALLLTIAAAGAIALAYFKRGSTEEEVE